MHGQHTDIPMLAEYTHSISPSSLPPHHAAAAGRSESLEAGLVHDKRPGRAALGAAANLRKVVPVEIYEQIKTSFVLPQLLSVIRVLVRGRHEGGGAHKALVRAAILRQRTRRAHTVSGQQKKKKKIKNKSARNLELDPK